MPIDYNENSRFRRASPILVGGVETQGRWAPPSWLRERPSPDLIRTYRVPNHHEGRPDVIAHEVYRNSELDWVLIAFNRTRSVLNWPRAGAIVEYPDESLVVPEL